jgi:hypothetical protein
MAKYKKYYAMNENLGSFRLRPTKIFLHVQQLTRHVPRGESMGWNVRTGGPLPETVRDLRLQEMGPVSGIGPSTREEDRDGF